MKEILSDGLLGFFTSFAVQLLASWTFAGGVFLVGVLFILAYFHLKPMIDMQERIKETKKKVEEWEEHNEFWRHLEVATKMICRDMADRDPKMKDWEHVFSLYIAKSRILIREMEAEKKGE